MDSRRDYIFSIKQASGHNGSGFFIFPIGDLRQFWTKDKVDNIVGHRPLQDHEFKFFQDNLLRTLSLLVYIKVQPERTRELIRSLIRDGTRIDQHLHLEEDEFKSVVKLQLGDVQQHFFDVRAWFAAPILKEGDDMNLEGVQRLPFVGDTTVLGYGMNGAVTGHKIASGHLQNKHGSSLPETLVAVKTLDPRDADKEIDILTTLRELLSDKNIQIYTCITIIKDRDRIHSLSLRATRHLGEKLQVLQRYRPQEFDRSRFVAAMQQMKGIVGAVEFLHNQEWNGPNTCFCHMDIKPENILIFEDAPGHMEEHWQLIDFGITTISDKKFITRTAGGGRDESRGPHITRTVGTKARLLRSRYQPPEINNNIEKMDEGKSGTYMGRGSDVWSFACVFSEVIAANLGNLNDLQDSVQPEFYEGKQTIFCFAGYSKPQYQRHNAFKHWLRDLGMRGQSNPALMECHDLIEKMTHIKRIRRLKSRQVLERMNASSTFGERH